MKFDNIDMWWL